MTSFPLKIVTPDGLIFDGEAEELVVRSTTGDVAVLAKHTNFVTPLGMGRAIIVSGGIRRTADALRTGRIVICAECVDCLREMDLYVWDRKAGHDQVRKEHDHAMDDMRYFVTGVLDARGGGFAARAVERGGG